MPADCAGIDLKIERAKKHLRDLDAAWDGFLKTDPYEVVPKDNPETGLREHTVTRADPLPDCFALIAGDVIHNLRSALDHLIYFLANGGKNKHEKAAFPVWDSESKCISGRPGNAKGISKTALDILYRLKPYKGGNDPLWRLHHLDIVDKHRLLLTIGAAHETVIFDPIASMRRAFPADLGDLPDDPTMLFGINSANLTPMVVGEVLMAGPLGEKGQDDSKFPPFIALDEPEVGELQPLIPALDQLINFTQDTVALFAAEIRAVPPRAPHVRAPRSSPPLTIRGTSSASTSGDS